MDEEYNEVEYRHFSTPISKEIANFKDNLFHSLNLNEERVYRYFISKIGNTRVPMVVPLIVVSKTIGISYMQVRRAVKKLKDKGLIEVFTTTHSKEKGVFNNRFSKTNYYRLPYQKNRLL